MDRFVFFGLSVNREIRDKKIAKKSIICKLRNIIKRRDIEQLQQFKKKHSAITLYHGYKMSYDSELDEYNDFINSLTMITTSQYYNNYHSDNTPNIIGNNFIDALFELEYININDIYVVIKMLRSMTIYEKWDDANYLIRKMYPSALKSYCSEEDDGYKYFNGIANELYNCNMTHYYGKIHGGAIKFFKLLKLFDINPCDKITGRETSHKVQTVFWNIEESISFQRDENPFEFEDCNIEYWDSLSTTPYDDIW